jgi:hypothetical protein
MISFHYTKHNIHSPGNLAYRQHVLFIFIWNKSSFPSISTKYFFALKENKKVTGSGYFDIFPQTSTSSGNETDFAFWSHWLELHSEHLPS